MVSIKEYKPNYEDKWLKCHLLSYYYSQYYDEILKYKPRYMNPVIELIAKNEGNIVGILDVEVESTPGQFCLDPNQKSGSIGIWGVLPKYRNKGIGKKLINVALRILKDDYHINRLEIWIRDDILTRRILQQIGFQIIPGSSFYQVYYDNDSLIASNNVNHPFNIFITDLTVTVAKEDFLQLVELYPPFKTQPYIALEYFIEE